jgi:hypothetical protein
MKHLTQEELAARFGLDDMMFVNSGVGKELNLRGINAKVIQAGNIHTNDIAEKIAD